MKSTDEEWARAAERIEGLETEVQQLLVRYFEKHDGVPREDLRADLMVFASNFLLQVVEMTGVDRSAVLQHITEKLEVSFVDGGLS